MRILTRFTFFAVVLVSSASATATIHLACGADLQSAINSATGGTTIRVARFQPDGITRCQWGSYALPYRADTGVVTIATDGAPPAAGTRTQPGDSYLALFVAQPSVFPGGNYGVFFSNSTGPNNPVHGYKFVGLELTTPADNAHISYGLIQINGYETVAPFGAGDIPYDFDVEHCYIHGGASVTEIAHGIQADASDLTVEDSYLSEIHSTFMEASAIWGNTTLGSWTIENNDLQAACENFFWGGSDILVPNLAPMSGLTFRYNYVHKPPSWRYSAYIMKNLFEMKNGTHALIDSNVFEYSWVQSQDGFAVLFTPRLEANQSLNATVQYITFTNNTVRHAVSGISLGLYDSTSVSDGYATLAQALAVRTRNYVFRNNLFDDLDGLAWGYPGYSSYGIQGTASAADGYTAYQTVDHNTFNFGPTAAINSAMNNYSVSPGSWYIGAAPTVSWTYNYSGYDMLRDGAEGPTAVLGGSVFNHNTMAFSFQSQATWDAAFPGQGNIVNATTNPDGRGANLSQLSALEALIKAGTRPASDPPKTGTGSQTDRAIPADVDGALIGTGIRR